MSNWFEQGGNEDVQTNSIDGIPLYDNFNDIQNMINTQNTINTQNMVNTQNMINTQNMVNAMQANH